MDCQWCSRDKYVGIFLVSHSHFIRPTTRPRHRANSFKIRFCTTVARRVEVTCWRATPQVHLDSIFHDALCAIIGRKMLGLGGNITMEVWVRSHSLHYENIGDIDYWSVFFHLHEEFQQNGTAYLRLPLASIKFSLMCGWAKRRVGLLRNLGPGFSMRVEREEWGLLMWLWRAGQR